MIFYGEGWQMNTSPVRPGTELATQYHSSLTPGVSFFSDTCRDLLRGSIFDSRAPGFVSGAICDKNTLNACFLGLPHWACRPEQRRKLCLLPRRLHPFRPAFPGKSRRPSADADRQNRLAAAFVFLSQGVPSSRPGRKSSAPSQKAGGNSTRTATAPRIG